MKLALSIAIPAIILAAIWFSCQGEQPGEFTEAAKRRAEALELISKP